MTLCMLAIEGKDRCRTVYVASKCLNDEEFNEYFGTISYTAQKI